MKQDQIGVFERLGANTIHNNFFICSPLFGVFLGINPPLVYKVS